MTIEEAIRLVETLGTSPLLRIAVTMPRNYTDRRYATWNVRRSQVEAEVIASLTERGARISGGASDATMIRFAGVTASSTMGLSQALKNWKSGAEKRVSARRRIR